MLKVYIYKIENKIDMNSLPKVVLDHVNRYTEKKAKALSAFAWVKACSLLVDYGFNFKHLSFKEDKPVITKSKIFFNISHSENCVAIAISDCPVGVDIQIDLLPVQVDGLIKDGFFEHKYNEPPLNKHREMYATEVFTKFEANFKMQHFQKKIIFKRHLLNTFHLLIEKEPYTLTIVNEKDDKIAFNKLEFGSLKVKNVIIENVRGW